MLDGVFPKIVDCVRCLYLIHIGVAYIGYFILMYVLSFTLNLEYMSMSYFIFIYYIVIETIISMLVIDE
jgi:hypothetical protein